MMQTLDDLELVRAARAGDRDAYSHLMARHQRRLYRVCYGVTGNARDAEELAHDALVEAYLKLAQLRSPELFGSWLTRIALNLAALRRRRERRQAGLPPEPSAHRAEPLLRQRLTRALARLSHDHREVLVLHYWEGLSYAETARFLRLPVGTVMSRLFRARTRLREVIDLLPEDEEAVVVSEDDLRREVEAEISVLLRHFHEDREAAERLTVVFNRSPECLVAMLRDAESEEALDDLALLARRLGPEAAGVLVACHGSPEAALRERSASVLRRALAPRGKAGGAAPRARMPRPEAYLLLDALVQSDLAPERKVSLLADLMQEAGERESLLAMNLLLCYPLEAEAELLRRFWEARSPDELQSRFLVMQALCRMGTRFAAALTPRLRPEDEARAVAMAGAEALARTLKPDWLDKWAATGEELPLDTRFRAHWAVPPRRLRDPEGLRGLVQALSAFLESEETEMRNAAVRALGYLRSEAHADRLTALAKHPDPSTRLTVLRALGDLGTAGAAEVLREAAVTGSSQEQRAAVEAMGRLRVPGIQPLLLDLLRRGSTETKRAAVVALGEVGDEEAVSVLRELLSSPDRTLVKAASSALYGRGPGGESLVSAAPIRPPDRLGERWPRYSRTSAAAAAPRPSRVPALAADRVREGARPGTFISLEAALREIPEIREHDEVSLTRHIGRAAWDYSSTRRYLVEEGVLRRQGGVYQFTPLGEAAWRVEHFIRDRYLEGV